MFNARLGRGTWPPEDVRERWEQIETWRELSQADSAKIQAKAQTDRMAPRSSAHRYLTIPLGRLLTETAASLVCGGDKEFKPANAADADRLEEIVRENQLHEKVLSMAEVASGDGGFWARPIINDLTPKGRNVPLLEVITEDRAIPTFAAGSGEPIEVTFYSSAPWSSDSRLVLRLFERHLLGGIEYRVFLGTGTELGEARSVADWGFIDETSPLADASGQLFDQALVPDELMAVYVPNKLTLGPLGVSDLHGLDDILLASNRAFTAGFEDYLASAKLIEADEKWLNQNGHLVEGVKVATKGHGMAGEKKTVSVESPTFDAQAHMLYLEGLIDLSLQLAGISPASLGRDISGEARSGEAVRMRMAHSLVQAARKRSALQAGVAHLLRSAALLDDVATFGRKQRHPWADARSLPTVKLTDGLPVDMTVEAQRAVILLRNGLGSQRTAVETAQPHLSEVQLDAEIAAINGAEQASADRTAQAVAAGVQAAGGVRPLTVADITGTAANGNGSGA